MTIRHSLLALLADQPTHGYGLKSSFERTTAGTWPLNVGQVYTTLARLERDGLVSSEGDTHTQRQTWRLTDAGRAALRVWYDSPVEEEPPARNELALKVLLAVAADSVDVSTILRSQRVATMDRLQRYTREKRSADPDRDLTWTLLLDALILLAEAEIRWIDLCEERLRARGPR